MRRYRIGVEVVGDAALYSALAVGLATALTTAIGVSAAAKNDQRTATHGAAGAVADEPGSAGNESDWVPSIEPTSQRGSRIPIGTATTSGDGVSVFRIDRPGVYYLTGDLTGTEGKCGIEVAVGDVDIDLAGFALIGVRGSLDGIHVHPTQGSVVVRNGTIRDWGGTGVEARDAAVSRILDVVSLRNEQAGFALGAGGLMLRSISQGSPEDTFAPFAPLLCRDAACSQFNTLFLSLPINSSITNAATLFASVPNAVSVQKYNRATDSFWAWNGTTCGGSPEPGCASSCFCVNPGEGFVVTVSAPAPFTISGIDGAVTIPLIQQTSGVSLFGKNLISLPYCTSITTAKQLMDSIGFSQVTNVQKFICSSNTLLTYTGRAPDSSANNFPVVPGEAYFVRMKTTVNYVPPYTPDSPTCTRSSCPCPVGNACDDGDACTTNDTCRTTSGSGGIAEYFDLVTAPALPSGWTQQVITGTATDAWKTVNTTSDSPPNSAFTNAASGVTNKVLDTPAIAMTCSVPRMTFRNNFNLQSVRDGGVLEIKIGAGSFQDILAAGGSFVYGGYTGTILAGTGSPIAGRAAWTGSSGGFITTRVNLPAATVGQSIVLRWRVATDSSISGIGQFIDTVEIGSNCCAGDPLACNDGNACTDDACVGPTTGCVFTPDNSNTCSDGNLCTSFDGCSGGNCGGTPISCVSDQCITRACNGTSSCTVTPRPNGTSCDDGNPCTVNDACTSGVCAGTSPSHTVTGEATADNEFAIYTGATEAPGMTVNYRGVAACHPAAPSVSFSTTDRYLYVAAWSDDGAAQGLLHDLSVDGQPVFSGNSRWSVAYTDSDQDVCNTPPLPAIATTMAATIPSPPGGWVAPAVGCANPPPGQNCYGLWGHFASIDLSALRTWYNSGGDPSPNAPFQPGFNHREFLIFRLDMCNGCGPNGSACNDGNACTTGDTCTGGVCVSGAPVSCSDGNSCTSDSCNISTGACTHANITGSCDDGNGCTQTDTCQSGTCAGSNPVVCTALDQCHNVGTCTPATGVCTNPNKPNGTTCNDANACTQPDTCQSGSCTGTNPVVCTALDQCHVVGICNPATGTCSNPNAANGAACDDGEVCTAPDTCHDGACGCYPAPSVTTYQNTVPVTIPTTVAVISSSIPAGPVGRFLGGVRVTTNISHSRNADLDITLTSPSGSVVTLTSDNGTTNDNVFNGTRWDDDANPSGQVPYGSNTGLVTDATTANNVVLTPVVPEEALAAFRGEDPNGTWTLRVSDDTAGEGGTLAGWTLELTTFPDAPSTATATFSNGSVQVLADNPGVTSSAIVVATSGTVIDRVRARTFIRHTFPGDLDMTLRSPSGTVVTLTTDNGGTRDNVFNGTLWDDRADPAGQVPFSADSFAGSALASDTVYTINIAKPTLVPEEALGAFQGEDPNGAWTLTISDDSSGDTGTLDQWSLEITTIVDACNRTCGDLNDCTSDSCDPQTGCANVPIPCNDNNPCTDDSCDPAAGCVYAPRPENSPCDDDNPCTLNDICVAGACSGTEVSCDDGNPCTDNYCAPLGGGGVCFSVPHDGLSCNDDDVCTVGDHCQSGDCVATGPLDCNDANPCTNDSCDSSLPGGCFYVNNLLPCDDGNACTSDDNCKAPAAGPGGLSENFDAVSFPALPVGWTQQVIQGDAIGWSIDNTQSHTPPNSVSTGDRDFSTDKVLTSPAFFVGCPSPVTFRNNYDLEAGYDGAVLEVSIAGAPFADIVNAGGTFIVGGYNATISTAYGSPIGGHRAWSGNSGGFIVTSVNLPPSAVGHSIRLRWRIVTDAEICDNGLFIDTIVAGWCPNICSGTSLVCNDSNPCTDDACAPASGCVFTANNTATCTDGDRCTFDHCTGGVCVSDGGSSPRPVNDSLRVSRSGTSALIEWNDPPGPYDVYVGTRTIPWNYNHACFDGGTVLTSTTHHPVPAPGSLFYYLVGRRDGVGASILGRDGACNPIPNPSPCP